MVAKDERGYTLITVLLVVLLLTVLGGAYILAMNFEVRQSFQHENRVQAYYYARSGAEVGLAWLKNEGILDGSKEFNGEPILFQGDPHKKFEKVSSFNQQEKIEIKLERIDQRLEIKSRGRFLGSNIEEEVRLTLKLDGGSVGPFDNAIFAVTPGIESSPALEVGGSARIDGPVGLNSISSGAVQLGWATTINGNISTRPGADPEGVFSIAGNRNIEDYLSADFKMETTLPPEGVFFPDPLFPEFPTDLPSRDDFGTPWVAGEYYEISQDGHYDSIEVTANRTLTIDLQGGDRVIRVRNLNSSQGHIELINSAPNSRLVLYIEENFVVGGSSQFNSGGDFQQVEIFYSGDSNLSIAGATRIVGSLHLERAGLSLAGSNNLEGHIISNGNRDISITGAADINPKILYAPEAHVKVGGSGRIRGSVIASSADIDGSGEITYEKPDISTAPAGIFPEEWYSGEGTFGSSGFIIDFWE